MVSDTDTIGRLCEMTGGGLYDPKLLQTLIRVPSTLLYADGPSLSRYSDSRNPASTRSNKSERGIQSHSSLNVLSTSSIRTVRSSDGLGRGNENNPFSYRSMSAILADSSTLAPSALQKAMFFRVSPLSAEESNERVVRERYSRSSSKRLIEGMRLSSTSSARLKENCIKHPFPPQQRRLRSPVTSMVTTPSSPEIGFKYILQRWPLQCYLLRRVSLERLVEMRHSEGLKLVEACFSDDLDNADNRDDAINGIDASTGDCGIENERKLSTFLVRRSTKVSLSWSLQWQTDVLLKYSIEFCSAGRTGTSTGVILGDAQVNIDVVCNYDFFSKLYENGGSSCSDSGTGEATIFCHSGTEERHRLKAGAHAGRNDWHRGRQPESRRQTARLAADRPRDRIFNNPAVQMNHFLLVLKQVDEMLVQLCGLFLPSLMALKQNPRARKEMRWKTKLLVSEEATNGDPDIHGSKAEVLRRQKCLSSVPLPPPPPPPSAASNSREMRNHGKHTNGIDAKEGDANEEKIHLRSIFASLIEGSEFRKEVDQSMCRNRLEEVHNERRGQDTKEKYASTKKKNILVQRDGDESKDDSIGDATVMRNRYLVVGQLSVRDWHRWFSVAYFEIREKKSEVHFGSLTTMPGIRISPAYEHTNAARNYSPPSRDSEVGLRRHLQQWCFSNGKSGRILKDGSLYLRHIHGYAVSDSAKNSFATGFCLVKVSWNSNGKGSCSEVIEDHSRGISENSNGSGVLATFHLGFFGASQEARAVITAELQQSLESSSTHITDDHDTVAKEWKESEGSCDGATIKFVVIKRDLASKMVVSATGLKKCSGGASF
jgi:hypothetical protein